MAAPARKLWTLDGFLAFDDGTDTRFELIGGEIVAMTPPSGIHGALAARLGATIRGRLRRPCEVVVEAGIVLPDRVDTYYPADLAVTCAGLTSDPSVPEPEVIAEILSPSTAATDYPRKLPDYRGIPSVQDIFLVSSTEARIERWRREVDGWKVQDLRGPAGVDASSTSPTCTRICCRAKVRGKLRAERGARFQPRPCGSSQSMSGPLGTMPVGFTVSWLP